MNTKLEMLSNKNNIMYFDKLKDLYQTFNQQIKDKKSNDYIDDIFIKTSLDNIKPEQILVAGANLLKLFSIKRR